MLSTTNYVTDQNDELKYIIRTVSLIFSKMFVLCSGKVHSSRLWIVSIYWWWEQLQNTPQLIYMSLNKNSVYCVRPRSSKPPDTCKWGGPKLRGILKFSLVMLSRVARYCSFAINRLIRLLDWSAFSRKTRFWLMWVINLSMGGKPVWISCKTWEVEPPQ